MTEGKEHTRQERKRRRRRKTETKERETETGWRRDADLVDAPPAVLVRQLAAHETPTAVQAPPSSPWRLHGPSRDLLAGSAGSSVAAVVVVVSMAASYIRAAGYYWQTRPLVWLQTRQRLSPANRCGPTTRTWRIWPAPGLVNGGRAVDGDCGARAWPSSLPFAGNRVFSDSCPCSRSRSLFPDLVRRRPLTCLVSTVHVPLL